jgi:iron-sulfur cluster protein
VSQAKRDLKKQIHASLENTFLRQSMDHFTVAYREAQKKAFSQMDKKKLVDDISKIKDASVTDIWGLYKRFKENAEKKGVAVHYAKTALDANLLIADIALQNDCKAIVKSKSMTSEETHLNAFLQQKGLNVTETDLGEWIIQLRHEGPSHMVMPAIHLSRHQVADLFHDVTKQHFDPEDIENLVRVARKQLKEKFFTADMGITGANFLLADTGTIGIVTNEGNARLTSTLPDTHVILAGMDKIVPGLNEAFSILKILPRNATGQAMTSYATWITGQGECKSRGAKKKNVHIVILDNGRSRIASDPALAPVLKCLRCGACANVCPVYRMVGGHTMGHIYIGAVGLILTFLFHGKENAEKLIGNCIGCGACREICAAGIDLPEIIRHTSLALSRKSSPPVLDRLLAFTLRDRSRFHKLLKLAKRCQTPFADKNGYLRHMPLMFMPEHRFKSLPVIAEQSFRDYWEKEAYTLEAPELKVALFAGCLQDFVYPEHLRSLVSLMKKNNIQVVFPLEQSCCGLPLKMADRMDAAETVAQENINAFSDPSCDFIVTLCASCASHLKEGYVKLFDTTNRISPEKVSAFTEKIRTSSQFIKTHIPITKSRYGVAITFHTPCHLRGVENGKACAKSILQTTGADIIDADEEDTCCGFGGSYSAKYPEISAQILNKKCDDFTKTGADIIATECPGCVLQLKGGMHKKGINVSVKHIAELL